MTPAAAITPEARSQTNDFLKGMPPDEWTVNTTLLYRRTAALPCDVETRQLRKPRAQLANCFARAIKACAFRRISNRPLGDSSTAGPGSLHPLLAGIYRRMRVRRAPRAGKGSSQTSDTEPGVITAGRRRLASPLRKSCC